MSEREKVRGEGRERGKRKRHEDCEKERKYRWKEREKREYKKNPEQNKMDETKREEKSRRNLQCVGGQQRRPKVSDSERPSKHSMHA